MKHKHETLRDFVDQKASKMACKLTLSWPNSHKNNDWRLGYDWGAYDGYKAGFMAGRKFAKQRR